MKRVTEREIRYLLPPFQVDLAQASGAVAISEVHLTAGSLGTRIRRIQGDDCLYELTFKFRAMDHSLEHTLTLAQEEGRELFDRCRAHGFPYVCKTRYFYTFRDNLQWEVDMYGGPFNFVAIAELEYDRIEPSLLREKPSWYLGDNWGCKEMDVTDEWQLLSKMLSLDEVEIKSFDEAVRRRIHLIGSDSIGSVPPEELS